MIHTHLMINIQSLQTTASDSQLILWQIFIAREIVGLVLCFNNFLFFCSFNKFYFPTTC
jgi:hypothetical protein